MAHEKLIQILNKVLADEFTLYVKTLNFHWNVEGLKFVELHKFFEELYEEQQESVDAIAERIRILQERPLASMRSFIEQTTLQEHDSEPLASEEMIKNLLADYQSIILTLKQAIDIADDVDDDATEDFFIEQLQIHEKRTWMLRSLSK